MMMPANEERFLGADENTLSYTLRRTGRRRTIGIIVEPDSRVVVLAPVAAELHRVEQIVRRRLPWIRRQRRSFEALPPPPLPRQWVAGETHRYLGRQYRLKLFAGSERSVRLVGGSFLVTLPNPANRAAVRHLMEGWYFQHAKALLSDRVRSVMASTTWLDIPTPPTTIRVLRRQWGSTTKSGRISFNVDLVKLPLPCVDYVVAHELVHLKIPSHRPAFWRMLGRVMPDWKRWRERLVRAEV
jgi:predicted metal-dependent hydrolase